MRIALRSSCVHLEASLCQGKVRPHTSCCLVARVPVSSPVHSHSNFTKDDVSHKWNNIFPPSLSPRVSWSCTPEYPHKVDCSRRRELPKHKALGEFHVRASGPLNACRGDEMTLACSPTPFPTTARAFPQTFPVLLACTIANWQYGLGPS